MFHRIWLTIQTANMFLNSNHRYKTAMPIPAILSGEKDPPDFPVPVPVPQRIWNPDHLDNSVYLSMKSSYCDRSMTISYRDILSCAEYIAVWVISLTLSFVTF